MNEALQNLNEVLSNLRSVDHIVLLLVAVMGLGFFIAWNASPWRTLVAWLATTSIQLEAGSFHLSLSDLFILPLVAGAFMTWLRSRDKQVRIPSALLAFTLLFLTAGNIVTALSLGKLPQWTWLNKDLGLIGLLMSYWAILVICRSQSLTESAIRAFVSSVSVINLVGLCLYVGSLIAGFGSIVNYDGMRFKGFMLDPNGYAGVGRGCRHFPVCHVDAETKEWVGRDAAIAESCAFVHGVHPDAVQRRIHCFCCGGHDAALLHQDPFCSRHGFCPDRNSVCGPLALLQN